MVVRTRVAYPWGGGANRSDALCDDVGVFTVEERDCVRDRLLEVAAADERVVAGAEVGSLAGGAGDRWSDLDLTFGVAEGVALDGVLRDWTERVESELDAMQLFDVTSGPTIYRVFLLPGGLQVDLSFTPEAQFGAGGPRFRVLFGEAVGRPPAALRPAADVFGWGVAWARTARACIERGRLWMAEYCVSSVRDHALTLACRRRDLPMSYGRGFDDLPPDVLAALDGALVRSLERDELLRALRIAIEGLLRESGEIEELAAKAAPRMREWLE
jgi:hypothetical protein